jgi:hypothetical protein
MNAGTLTVADAAARAGSTLDYNGGTSSYQMTKSDTYSDGSDSQTVNRWSTDLCSTANSNSITGDYSDSSSGTVATTIAESGDRGAPYTSNSSDSYGYSKWDNGNSVSGDYANGSSSTDTGTQTRTTTMADGGTFTVSVSNGPLDASQPGESTTGTGNSLTGLYTSSETKQETNTTHETSRASDGYGYLRGLASLQSLRVGSSRGPRGGTRVTEAGLENLRGLKNLSYLDLWGTRVSAAGARSLQQVLPRCHIDSPDGDLAAPVPIRRELIPGTHYWRQVSVDKGSE